MLDLVNKGDGVADRVVWCVVWWVYGKRDMAWRGAVWYGGGAARRGAVWYNGRGAPCAFDDEMPATRMT